MPNVNHKILEWARESVGISLEEAAQRLEIRPIGQVAASDRLFALEQGLVKPTRQMLVKMSKQYRRPLLLFYMSAPPSKGARGEDFRTLPQQQAGPINSLVDTLVRDVRARQDMVRSLLEEAGEANRLAFVGSAKLTDGVESLVMSLSKAMDVTGDQYQDAANPEEGFALLRSAAEREGVFVLLIGNLGSHHTAIDVEVFRGFALADDVAPFAVINDLDAKTAWAFTLIHEIAHLWLGATGISGPYGESQLERYCNDVASEFLLPARQLASLRMSLSLSFSEVRDRVREFSGPRNLSATMVAYRLYRSNVLDWNMFEQLRAYFRQQWAANRETARADAREEEGGPDYYVLRRHRVGRALLELVRRTMAEGMLTPTKAGKLLGVKAMNVYEMVGNATQPQ